MNYNNDIVEPMIFLRKPQCSGNHEQCSIITYFGGIRAKKNRSKIEKCFLNELVITWDDERKIPVRAEVGEYKNHEKNMQPVEIPGNPSFS